MKQNKTNLLIAIVVVLAAAATRVFSTHLGIYNFMPIAAVSLFCGSLLREKRQMAFLLPLLAQFLADLYFQAFTYVPGFYWAVDQLFTYGGIIGATSLGLLLKKHQPLTILGLTVSSSFVFFALSNFGYFAHGWNGYTMQGFIKTYADAIAFYRTSLLGNPFVADIIGSAVLFGGYALSQKAITAQHAEAKA